MSGGGPAGNDKHLLHGIYQARDNPDGMAIERRSRLSELEELLKTEPGRQEYRVQLVARLAIMCEIGFNELAKISNTGQSIWISPPVKNMGTYINTLARLIDNWPEEGKRFITAQTVIDAIKAAQDTQSGEATSTTPQDGTE